MMRTVVPSDSFTVSPSTTRETVNVTAGAGGTAGAGIGGASTTVGGAVVVAEAVVVGTAAMVVGALVGEMMVVGLAGTSAAVEAAEAWQPTKASPPRTSSQEIERRGVTRTERRAGPSGSPRAAPPLTRVVAMLITTSNDFPGYEVIAVYGEVFGLTVRSRNIGAGCVAGLRSLAGGEIPGFTKLLTQSRNEAMARMVEEAKRRGANAILAMRFDSGAIGQWSEICAYGTAIWVQPVSEAAKQQHDAMVAAGEMPHQQDYAVRVSEWGSSVAPVPGSS